MTAIEWPLRQHVEPAARGRGKGSARSSPARRERAGAPEPQPDRRSRMRPASRSRSHPGPCPASGRSSGGCCSQSRRVHTPIPLSPLWERCGRANTRAGEGPLPLESPGQVAASRTEIDRCRTGVGG
jgi:hypothetical protein